MLATGLVSFLVARVSRLVLPAINVFYIRSREDFHMFNSFTPLPFFVGSLSFTAGNTTTGNE